MMPAARRRAIVVGGSMGGLFAAHNLRRAGWAVDVYERVAEDLAGRGAGLGAPPMLFDAMRRIGVPEASASGVECGIRVCLDRAGETLCTVEMAQTMSSWSRVHLALHALLPAQAWHPGRALADVEQGPDGVTAVFEDGAREHADLLVAADGVRSTVRARLLPEAVPRYAGYVAWRGIVHEDEWPAGTRAQVFERYLFCLPEGEMMLVYPVPGRDDDVRPGRRGANFVWYRPTDLARELPAMCTDRQGVCHGTAIPPPLIRDAVIARMRADARALLAPLIADIVERTPRPFFHAIFDLESPTLRIGRVVLLGDAAAVARPHVGVGVTKAATDAECLADCLAAAGDDIDSALARYDRLRRAFASHVVARARRLGAYIEARTRPPEARTPEELDQDPLRILTETGSRATDLEGYAALADRVPAGA